MDLKTAINIRKPVHLLTFDNVDQYELISLLEKVPNKYYVQQVLRKYMRSISESAIIEEMYEFYTTVLSASNPEKDVLIYTIGDRELKIIEQPTVFSNGGVTGIRTWEASVFLANWLTTNTIPLANGTRQKLQGNIVEIGCGTGLVGLSLLPCRVVFTDMDMGVLNTLRETIKLNHPDLKVNDMDYSHIVGEENFKDPFKHNLGMVQLSWGKWSVNCDYVVGSDISYDSTIHPELIECLRQFTSKGAVGIISATIRKEKTIEEWEERLEEFEWEILNEQGGIKVYKIVSKSQIIP